MKESNKNTHKNSQKEEQQYIQYALFDLEGSGPAIPSLAPEADHILSQSSQSRDVETESMANNKEHETKGYFPPKEINRLMVDLLDPQPGTTVYDPCCGLGAFLMAALQHLEKKYAGSETALFGQESRANFCVQARTRYHVVVT